MKTRSAYIKAPWQCELRTVDLPDEPPAGWVLLKVAACGVCGTDLTAAEQKKDWGPVGHEIAGVIEKTGAGVEGLKSGQSVALESCSFCGRCPLCRDGRVDLCNKNAPNFWRQPAMGMSDWMLAPAVCCVPYSGLSAEEACLVEPLGVAYDMVKTADIQMGDRVCLVGPGAIGLAGAALAIHRGASRMLVIGRSSNAKRLEVAARLGAETLATDAPLNELADLRQQFDHVLMTAPTQYLSPALALLAYGGEMTYIGIGVGDGSITFDANDFHFRKLQLRASFASPAIYYPAVMRLLRAGVLPGKTLISHIIPLSEVGKAFEICRDKKQDTLKVVIKP
ncbi:MAG: alcohol dehydrogenase catalytic domain-containing protein [Candidatus Sumerlaeota bacterium]|nr:alcohol dehydrogenase catalytic domain-containing protein [Candidatus Sumerlaeota bacterium]